MLQGFERDSEDREQREQDATATLEGARTPETCRFTLAGFLAQLGYI
jgi:hypothetical protein